MSPWDEPEETSDFDPEIWAEDIEWLDNDIRDELEDAAEVQ